MPEAIRTGAPFEFYSRLNLTLLTGSRAHDLPSYSSSSEWSQMR